MKKYDLFDGIGDKERATFVGPADPERGEEAEVGVSAEGGRDKNRKGTERKGWAGQLAKACSASVN